MTKPLIKKVLVETTHTATSGLNTGLQRVIRNIVKNLPLVARDYEVEAEVVIFDGLFFQVVDEDRNESPATKIRDAGIVFGATCWRFFLRSICVILPSRRARQFVRAPAVKVGLTWYVLFPIRQLTHAMARRSAQGSTLILIDASWFYPDIWLAVGKFKENGGRVVGVVYDTIPISHPEACGDELPDLFKEWLFQMLAVSDGIVCISSFSARCVQDIVDTRVRDGLLERPPIISHFHLGAELDLVRTNDAVAVDVEHIFKRNDHIFLVVGSIDPRKNHSYILDAFERFWSSGGRATLLVIGKHGWGTDKFLERAAAHPKIGAELHVLRNASDADLEFAYKNASALVFASKIEGFGLPIVEAFQHGLPVLCSDIPVFREIADKRATFFDLSDPTKLQEAIVEFCRTHDIAKRAERSPQPYLTWEQSTRQLFNEVFSIHKQIAAQNLKK